MSDHAPTPPAQPARQWRPIGAVDRRILGVLVEKAKTTPDAYPMSVNALCTGANQKNNRAPIMEIETDDVEESLARLRQLGAVAEVQGGGRVSRYRHYLYEWLGVDKVELAVMAELLLRGPQTEGELRGRATRMEPIAHLNALRPVLDSLKAKQLIVPLTPAGRGHVLTHALYEPREMERLRSDYGNAGASTEDEERASPQPVARAQPPMHLRPDGPASMPRPTTAEESLRAPVAGQARPEAADALRKELLELREQVEQLRGQVRGLVDQAQRTESELAELKRSLGA